MRRHGHVPPSGGAAMQTEHRNERIGWLRPAVLGANDGIVSTASLLLGVAASEATHQSILVAGIAGLVAGAMSMATGEYVSVRSQSDIEVAETEIERRHIVANPEYETEELAAVYVKRGLDHDLAEQVAKQLMQRDALGAHLRDELGFSDALQPRPIQAAVTSALSFGSGAALPVLVAAVAPLDHLIPSVSAASLVSLAILGGLAASAGGAPIVNGAIRVTFWSALAMAFTAGVGLLFHVSV